MEVLGNIQVLESPLCFPSYFGTGCRENKPFVDFSRIVCDRLICCPRPRLGVADSMKPGLEMESSAPPCYRFRGGML